MIERTNPFKSIDKKTLKKVKETAKQVAIGGIISAMLFTMSGCGKKATDDLIKLQPGDVVPESCIQLVLKDGTYIINGQRMVAFKDKAFKAAFKGEDVNYYDLAIEYALSLTGPSDLEEIILLPNIRILYLKECELEDLSTICQLLELNKLNLSDCDNVTDLSFLLNMNLESLSLTDMSGIDDLSFIAKMSQLKNLTIDNCTGCKVDFEAIKKLDLTSLDLSFMEVADLDFLVNMHNLEDLSITFSNLKDISGISQLHNLKELDLNDCLLSDATPLYGLTNLESLRLSNNSINSFDITKFPNLKFLTIGGNYALYTEELFDYCQQHNIRIDITREEIKCVNEIRDIVKGLNLEGLSDAQKEAKIYSYVLANMDYDKEALSNEDLLDEYNVRTLYNALQGKGVCSTYVDFFNALCDVAGIDSYRVVGYGKNGLFNMSGGLHAWSLVEIDGKYMLCDPTWSDAIRDSFDYKVLHFFEEEKTDKYFNAHGEDARKFADHHIENALDRGDEDIGSPRTNDAISIVTNEENGEKISGAVLTGIMTGSVVALSAGAAAIAIHSKKKKRRKVEKMFREARAKSNGTYGRNNPYNY